MEKAATYLRSSKDRSDVSIDAQRRELAKLATQRGFLIVRELIDVVESAKDEHRPGFQQLLRELKSPDRQWQVLLLVDTSRLSRNQYIAQVFKHEADKRGVKIIYSKLPESNPIVDMMLLSIMRAFDEMHSMMSREKGLSGMAENVEQGYRAGGRAPLGYQLQHFATGAIRDGSPVTKSKLAPSPEAPWVAHYLKQRAAGIKRSVLVRADLLPPIAATSLVGMEWNALTYAGHTVWNVHNEHARGGYKGGVKRRPRSEWVIKYDTHDRLISTEEAEIILRGLETSSRGGRRRTRATYLLTGLLVTPEGAAWHGDGNGKYYRVGKGRKVRAEDVDQAVLRKMLQDLNSPRFIAALTRQARKQSGPAEEYGEITLLKDSMLAINAKVTKLASLVAEMERPRPLLEKISEMEGERDALQSRIRALEQQAASAQIFAAITEDDVRSILTGLAQSCEALDREQLKDFLAGLLESVVLNATDLTCRICYKIPAIRGDRMASPRGCGAIPSIAKTTFLRIRRAA